MSLVNTRIQPSYAVSRRWADGVSASFCVRDALSGVVRPQDPAATTRRLSNNSPAFCLGVDLFRSVARPEKPQADYCAIKARCDSRRTSSGNRCVYFPRLMTTPCAQGEPKSARDAADATLKPRITHTATVSLVTFLIRWPKIPPLGEARAALSVPLKKYRPVPSHNRVHDAGRRSFEPPFAASFTSPSQNGGKPSAGGDPLNQLLQANDR